MSAWKRPQFWLWLWGGVGAAALVYGIIAASVNPRPGDPSAPQAFDRALITGEMADFEYAYMPRSAPEIPFEFEGAPIALRKFRGKAILVNFWATWCAPCLEELPSLDVLQDRLGGKQFEVVAIAADPRGPEVAREFLDRLSIKNLKLYADPRLSFTTAIGGADILPVSILYDANGREIGRLIGGADWSSPEAERLIQSVIS